MPDYYQGAPLVINTTNTISGMLGVNYVPNVGVIAPDTDGRPVKCLVTEGTIAPALDISTHNIAQVMALLSASPNYLPTLALSSLKWFDRKQDTVTPGLASGTVHEQSAFALGNLFFTGLEGSANEPAVLSLMALGLSADGDTHPMASTLVAAPTDPLTIATMVLDSVTIDGTAIDEAISASIRASVEVQTEHGLKPYPRFARPRKVDWSLTVRHNNQSIQRLKTDKSATISTVWKLLNSGAPTRGATTLTWSVTGLLHSGGSNRPGSGDSETTHIVIGRHDGTNQPSTWAIT